MWAINNEIVLKLKESVFLRNNKFLCYHFTSYNWSWDWSPFVVALDPPYWCPLVVGAPWWCEWWWSPWWCESVGVALRSPVPLLPAVIGRSALPPPPTYNIIITIWNCLHTLSKIKENVENIMHLVDQFHKFTTYLLGNYQYNIILYLK